MENKIVGLIASEIKWVYLDFTIKYKFTGTYS